MKVLNFICYNRADCCKGINLSLSNKFLSILKLYAWSLSISWKLGFQMILRKKFFMIYHSYLVLERMRKVKWITRKDRIEQSEKDIQGNRKSLIIVSKVMKGKSFLLLKKHKQKYKNMQFLKIMKIVFSFNPKKDSLYL